MEGTIVRNKVMPLSVGLWVMGSYPSDRERGGVVLEYGKIERIMLPSINHPHTRYVVKSTVFLEKELVKLDW